MEWVRKAKNRDVITGPLARPFAHTAHSFACFTLMALLALCCAHSFAHPRAREKEHDLMSQNHLVLSYSALPNLAMPLPNRSFMVSLVGDLGDRKLMLKPAASAEMPSGPILMGDFNRDVARSE